MANRRLYCELCLYPKVTCVCSAVAPVICQSRIDVIQDASERKAAKNTARLIPLCIPHAKIWSGDSTKNLTQLRQSLSKESRQIMVVYPNDRSESLHRYLNDVPLTELRTTHQSGESLGGREYKAGEDTSGDCGRTYRLVFLDGTWRKAYKLWMHNDWLWQYPSIHIDDVESECGIRKAPSSTCLSTIEALVYSLALIEPKVDAGPLFSVFDKMQSYFYKRSKKGWADSF